MTEISFTEIGCINFGPYQQEMILKFEPDKIILIHGPNGVGKTMLLECLPFTIHGVTSKGMKGDDVVNNKVGKNCHTWVKFNDGNSEYKVDRYQKYSRYGGNTVHLFRDDMSKPILNGHKEVSPFIDKIVGPWKLLSNTLMFGQKVKDFFTDLGDADKRLIFRKLQGLDIYTIYYKESDKRIDLTLKEISKIDDKIKLDNSLIIDSKCQIEIFEIKEKKFLSDKQEKLKEINQEILKQKEIHKNAIIMLNNYKSIESELELLINNRNKNNLELQKIESEIQNLESNINSRKSLKQSEIREKANLEKDSQIKEVETKYEELIKKSEEDLKITEDKISELSLDSRNLENQILEHKSKIKRWEEDKNKIIENVLDKEISICPTCTQEVSEIHRVKLQHDIENYENQISSTTNLVKELEKLWNKKIRETEDFIGSKRKYLDALTKLKNDLKIEKIKTQQTIEKRIELANEKINELAKAELEKISKSQNEIKQNLEIEKTQISTSIVASQKRIDEKKRLELSIQSIVEKINNLEKNYKEKQLEEFDKSIIKSYEEKIINLTNDISSLMELRNSLDKKVVIRNTLKKAYSPTGIPAMLIDESIPFMNRTISTYLDEMSNGRYIVSFDTLSENKSGDFKDKISVNVFDNVTHANVRTQFSGGQTRLVDIATILTLRDLQTMQKGISFNIIIFDEIMDSLDGNSIEAVSKTLRNLSKGKTIVIISHQFIDEIEHDISLSLN